MTFNQRLDTLQRKTTDVMNETTDLKIRADIAQRALEAIARMTPQQIVDSAKRLALTALDGMNR